jgi:peroxiredoxin
VRDRLTEFADAEVVVITRARPRILSGFRTRFVSPLTVLADEARDVYRAYGLDTDDHSGDFVVDADGTLVHVFRTEGSERPPVDELIAAVREAARS